MSIIFIIFLFVFNSFVNLSTILDGLIVKNFLVHRLSYSYNYSIVFLFYSLYKNLIFLCKIVLQYLYMWMYLYISTVSCNGKRKQFNFFSCYLLDITPLILNVGLKISIPSIYWTTIVFNISQQILLTEKALKCS